MSRNTRSEKPHFRSYLRMALYHCGLLSGCQARFDSSAQMSIVEPPSEVLLQSRKHLRLIRSSSRRQSLHAQQRIFTFQKLYVKQGLQRSALPFCYICCSITIPPPHSNTVRHVLARTQPSILVQHLVLHEGRPRSKAAVHNLLLRPVHRMAHSQTSC